MTMRRSGVGKECTPFRRFWRRCGLERNELRRPVDRVQRMIAFGLLILFLAAAPPVAAYFAHWSYDSGMRAEQRERAHRHPVMATVLSTGGIGSSGDRYVHETVRAQWNGPDGRTHVDSLPAWKNAKVGSVQRIWVDDSGKVAVRPRPHSRTVTDSVYAAGAAVLGVAFPILVAYGLTRRRCDRRRDDLWEAAWARMDTDAGHNRPS
jgi:hypothetical protein